ncbi:protease pro-enzyme activation domain-containing protein [Catenulispora pinistramenti]|uniref:S53 family peptidase n=1 Tax=Catenulispora pinistramenti TaxID=2705254 RepID=UPI002E793FDC|nr:protease pro-enzyme activation domain-containing protein [Catenulispora pinistramenti]
MSKVFTRSRVVVAAAGCVALVAGGAVLGLSGSAQAAGASPAEQRNVQVWLTPDIAGATAFADSVSTPGGAGFHHYLSPNAYTARFGPSAAHAKAVSDWLSSVGMTQVRVSGGRDYVSAIGDPAKAQVPASLAPDVLGVTGIGEDGTPGAARAATSNQAAPACSQYWGQHVQSYQPAYQGLTKGSLPICGYSAAQLRAAYGATSANTGKGVTVALTEDSTPTAMFATLTDYAKANHLPAPRRDQFREVQGGAVCTSTGSTAATDRHAAAASAGSATSGPPVDDEAEMDSEAVYALAPDADQLMIVGGGCDQGLLDAALTVLTGDGNHPSATIESNSWQIPVGTEPAAVMHAIDLRAAAEGVGAYFASGDTPGLTMPASDPYATAVGGTTLGIGAHNERVLETGWSSAQASLDNGTWTDSGISSAGGGTSPDYAQPAYQKGVVPASMSQIRVGDRTVTGRAVPDISADGDPDTGMLVGYIQQGTDAKPGPYQAEPNAGTSLATPLVAALVADAQQGRTTAFGFINPLLYRLSGTAAVRDVLPPAAATAQQDRDSYTPASDGLSPSVDVFGVTAPGAGQQVIAKGYDTLTGVGTPNGGAFIAGLRKAAGR